MVGLVLSALWRRRAQAVLLFLLAVVAATAAAAAPVYIASSVQSLAAAAVSGSSSSERVVAASVEKSVGVDVLADLSAFADQVSRQMSLPGYTRVAGASVTAGMDYRATGVQNGSLAYRQDVCAHLAIDGACPVGPREVLVAESLGSRRGIAVGDRLAVRAGGMRSAELLTVVGLFRAVDPFDPYWGRGGAARAGDRVAGERLSEGHLFTWLGTFADLGQTRLVLTVDLSATPAAFRQSDPQILARSVEEGGARLVAENVQVGSGVRALADRIFYDQQLVYVGVGIGLGELLLISWFALFLAVGQTGQDRRADVGLLKMRGAGGWDVWRLVTGQSVLPVVAGGALGVLVGPRLAQWAGGEVADPALRRLVWYAVLGCAAVAVLGAVVAALVGERGMLSESVASLGRGVASASRGWRASIVDVAIAVLAIAAAYQVQADPAIPVGATGGFTQARGVGLLAPILLALAVGVLAARLIPVVAGRVGAKALRSGRLGSGLAAIHLARRPETSKVLGLLVVVVAVACGTAPAWSASQRAQYERAVAEVGADRVLAVRAPSVTQLLSAVRLADPDGRYAMAVVQQHSLKISTLAVDASRLAAVVPWLAAYGVDDWAVVANAMRPAPPAPITLAAGGLRLDATWVPAGTPARVPVGVPVGSVTVVATFVGSDPTPVTVAFGPVTAGRRAYQVPDPACRPAGQCRLVSLALTWAATPPGLGSALTVHALSNLGDESSVTDLTRWRASVALGARYPRVTAGPNGLTLAITAHTLAATVGFGATVHVLDTPTPVPILSTDGLVLGVVSDPRAALTDASEVPVRVVAAAAVLPRIGAGAMVDLEYADRSATEHAAANMQVWLAPNTPGAVVDRLRARLTVVSEDSVAARLRDLSTQGPAVALRFHLLAALVGVALAVVSFAVMTAVERRPRGVELAALRRQGLRHSVVRRAGLGGYLSLVGAAVLTGAFAAAAIAAVVPAALPRFGDGWDTLAAPGTPAYVLPVAALGLAAIFAVVAALAAIQLIVAVRRQTRSPS